MDSRRRFTEGFRIEAVNQITERGFAVKDVSQRLGVSPYSLYEWIKRYGVPTEDRLAKEDQAPATDNPKVEKMTITQKIFPVNETVRLYCIIFFVALFLRLIFGLYLQQYMWGEFRYVMPDTPTYLNAFMNLINNSRFCFDLTLQDSCFYRLPTYPFFVGINYLAFGELAWISVTIFQSIIDALSCGLAVAIARSLNFNVLAQRLVAVIFIFNPFTIVWTPIQYPEVLGVFLVLLAVYLILDIKNIVVVVFGAGAILVLAVWTKQYILASLILIPFLVAARPYPKKIFVMSVAIFISFTIFYSPWVIRNYTSYGELAVFSGKTLGIRGNLSDWDAAFWFLSIFYENNSDAILTLIDSGKIVLPASNFVIAQREQIDYAASLAFDTSPSLKIRRYQRLKQVEEMNAIIMRETQSDEKKVADIFNLLSAKAKADMGFFEYYRTSFEAFRKGFFKVNFSDSWGVSKIQALLFGFRGVMVILGIVAIFVGRGRVRWFISGVLAYWLSTLFVLSFVFRHVEMRYLLMSDALLFICSALTISWLVSQFFPKPTSEVESSV